MRSRYLLVVLALAGLGATCKGGDAKPPPPVSAAKDAPAAAPKYAEIPGVEITQVPPAQRQAFLEILNQNFCYCGCPRTLAACLSNRADCACVACSEKMTGFILNHFAAGMSADEVELLILEGFAEGYNGPRRELPIADHPTKGTDAAAFTIVEFADFRCGHCKEVHPILSALVRENPGIQLAYFYYPLGDEKSLSMTAAEAAEEARQQGKFWELADKLYEHQTKLDLPLIKKLAVEVGVDAAKLDAALAAGTHRERILADKKLGQKYGVMSTPSIYVNGRKFGLPPTKEYFMSRLAMELDRERCQ